MQLEQLIQNIAPVDPHAYRACLSRFDAIAKPLGGLGALEELMARIAAITRSADIDLRKKCVLVFCADNGVVKHGVTQTGSEVTTAIARMLADKRASVCTMANVCGAHVLPIDIGMNDTVPGVLDKKLARGTADMTQGPAMPHEMAIQAIMTGIELVRECREQGYQLIATGEAGIGNTTTSSAVASVLLGRDVETVTGRGAGLSDEGLVRKQNAIKRAIACNRPDPGSPIDVLAKVGGLDIAAMTGAFLGGAMYRVPIVMDGFISSVAALIALRLCEAVRGYILPSHMSGELAARAVMDELDMQPVLHANMHLGEGTGAVALFGLLDMAASVYNSGVTFESIAVDAYRRFP